MCPTRRSDLYVQLGSRRQSNCSLQPSQGTLVSVSSLSPLAVHNSHQIGRTPEAACPFVFSTPQKYLAEAVRSFVFPAVPVRTPLWQLFGNPFLRCLGLAIQSGRRRPEPTWFCLPMGSSDGLQHKTNTEAPRSVAAFVSWHFQGGCWHQGCKKCWRQRASPRTL